MNQERCEVCTCGLSYGSKSVNRGFAAASLKVKD